MSLLKDLKFQVALATLAAAGVHYYAPDIDVDSLVDIVLAVLAVIIGGHSVAEKRKK